MVFRIENCDSVMEIFDESRKGVEAREDVATSSVSLAHVLVETFYDFVRISVAKEEKEKYSAFFFVSDLDERCSDDEDVPMTIDDVVFAHSERVSDELTLFHEDRFTGVVALLEYLFRIFTGALRSVTFVTGTVPSADISAFLVKAFRLDAVAQCSDVFLFENGVSSTAMIDEILELAVGLKRLDLRCTLPEDWKNPKLLRLDILISWPSEWLSTQDLINVLDCECAQLNETNLNWRAFKLFMLKWQATSDRSRLKMLEISFDGDWDGWQHDGLEDLHEWDRTERDSHFPDVLGRPDSDWHNCEFALDIRRADGLLASFWRRENSFHFVVWHDRRPIATLNPRPEQLVRLEPEQFKKEEEEDVDDEEEEEEEEEDE